MERFEKAIMKKENTMVKYHPTYRAIDDFNIIGSDGVKIEYDIIYLDLFNEQVSERKYFKMEDVWLYE